MSYVQKSKKRFAPDDLQLNPKWKKRWLESEFLENDCGGIGCKFLQSLYNRLTYIERNDGKNLWKRHGIETMADLVKLECELNNHQLDEVHQKAQVALGRIITYFRLCGVWPENASEKDWEGFGLHMLIRHVA